MIRMSIHRRRGHPSLLSLLLVEDFCMHHLYRENSLPHQSNPCLPLWWYVVSQLSMFAVPLSRNIPACSMLFDVKTLIHSTYRPLLAYKPVYHHITGPMKKLARLVGRGNLTSIAGFVIKSPALKSKVLNGIQKIVGNEIKIICSDKEKSIFHDKSHHLENFSWEPLWSELSSKAPVLLSIMKGCTPKKADQNVSSLSFVRVQQSYWSFATPSSAISRPWYLCFYMQDMQANR